METGRFQPAIEQERFGGTKPGRGFRPSRHATKNDLAAQVLSERRALSVSFVRAAYGATGVKQNPGDPAFGSDFVQKLFTQPRLQDPLPDDTINNQDKPQAEQTAAAPS